MADLKEQEKNTKDVVEETAEDVNESEVTAESVDTEAETEEAAEETSDGEATDDSEASDGDKEEKKESKFFKKKDKNKDKEKIAELEDKVLRQMAEFENFRRRTEKEKSQMFETGAKNVIEKLLPVVDNFERGLATAPEGDAFADGMQMIYKQLMTELDNMGVKPIEAVGTEFNPDFHNAVMQVASEEFESGVVAQELQKGYTYHDSVVRHSMVAVVE